MISEGDVFPCMEIHDQPLALAILGDMGDAGRTTGLPIRSGPRQGQGIAVQGDPARTGAHPAQNFQKFGLPVTGYSRDPKDFSGAD